MFPETRQPDALTKPSVLLPVERDVERELDSGESSASNTSSDVVATSKVMKLVKIARIRTQKGMVKAHHGRSIS